MAHRLSRRVLKATRNLSNLLHGYNLYVNRDKLRLIDITFKNIFPQARSFADLGGVWKVNAAYSIHTLKEFRIDKGILVDTDYPQGLKERLRRFPQLSVIEADFSSKEAAAAIGSVDVIYFFDVLLHQANPDWDEVLTLYSKVCPCFVIYNQQFIQGEDAVRLTDLPLEKYIELASDFRFDLYKYVYDHKTEIHPKYDKPWGDIHNLAQWGITDKALRETLKDLGYEEVYYANHGRFLGLSAFENHAFIFKRRLT
jgi:hypothetical protein